MINKNEPTASRKLAPASLFLFAATCVLSSQTVKSPELKTPRSTSVDHRRLAEDYVAQNRWRDAEKEYRIYRNEHPDLADAVVRHAEALTEIGQPFDAALELQKFLQTHPDSTRALELHAVLASSFLHDPATAERDLEKCIKLEKNDFFAWKSLGDLYLDQQGKDEQAIKSYVSALSVRPQDPVVIASLAYVRSRNNATADAQKGFEEALRLTRSPADSLAVEMLYGRYLLDMGKKQEAVAAFGKALDASRNSEEALSWRAEALAELKEWTQAESDALAALKESPGDKRAALLLVRIYRGLGNTDKAQEYAEIVQKLAAAEDAHFALGRSLRDSLGEVEPLLLKGDYAAATTRYEAIVKMLPTFYEAYFDLGMCYSQTGRLQDAEAAFRKYLSFQPVSADGHASLGVLLLEENRGMDAIPELKEAIQIDPSLIEARKALANEYLQIAKPQNAVEVLRPAEDEKDEQLLVLLAFALKQTSDDKGAMKVVDKALLLKNNDAGALQLKQELLAAQKH